MCQLSYYPNNISYYTQFVHIPIIVCVCFTKTFWNAFKHIAFQIYKSVYHLAIVIFQFYRFLFLDATVYLFFTFATTSFSHNIGLPLHSCLQYCPWRHIAIKILLHNFHCKIIALQTMPSSRHWMHTKMTHWVVSCYKFPRANLNYRNCLELSYAYLENIFIRFCVICGQSEYHLSLRLFPSISLFKWDYKRGLPYLSGIIRDTCHNELVSWLEKLKRIK